MYIGWIYVIIVRKKKQQLLSAIQLLAGFSINIRSLKVTNLTINFTIVQFTNVVP